MGRITPAGAGKTFTKYFTASFVPDHPRRCGENSPQRQRLTLEVGSPPQVRGKHSCACGRNGDTGITPAGAGKTNLQFCGQIDGADHPRRCGENTRTVNADGKIGGSPPQVRGKQLAELAEIPAVRITPAGAGKTVFTVAVNYIFRDHPRRCGENLRRKPCVRPLVGSPPQVRGKPS